MRPRPQPRLGQRSRDQRGVVAVRAQPLPQVQRPRPRRTAAGTPAAPSPRGVEERAHARQVHAGILARRRDRPARSVTRPAGTRLDRVLITGLDSPLALSPECANPEPAVPTPATAVASRPTPFDSSLIRDSPEGEVSTCRFPSSRSRTASSSSPSRPSRPRRPASSSRTPPRRSPRRARSSRSAPAASTTTAQRVPLDVKVGDKVIYSKYGGTEVKYGGEEYLILSARDVLAVVEK